jgi:hypothetical protein
VDRRGRKVVRAFADAQERDLRELPGVDRRTYPGPFGTRPERTDGSAPEAPTLDSDALYTGESREEDYTPDSVIVPVDATGYTTLCTLRRPWPFAGFAVDTSRIPSGITGQVFARVVTRLGRAIIVGNVLTVIPATLPITGPVPGGWVAVTGLYAGARLELVAQVTTGSEAGDVVLRAVMWGFNAPGFGP